MLSNELLEKLVCPKCQEPLKYVVSGDGENSSESLNCNACRLKYTVVDNIPNMLIDEAQPF